MLLFIFISLQSAIYFLQLNPKNYWKVIFIEEPLLKHQTSNAGLHINTVRIFENFLKKNI